MSGGSIPVNVVGVAIGMGSNVGDRAANLRLGLDGLGRLMDRPLPSSLYETVPLHMDDQPKFLNACCVGRTRLPPRQLLEELKRLEGRAGRRTDAQRYGPRPLDLDLLLYGRAVIEGPGLTVPHPRIRDRAFVLVPLAELVPHWTIPASAGQPEATVRELAARADRIGVERTNRGWKLLDG